MRHRPLSLSELLGRRFLVLRGRHVDCRWSSSVVFEFAKNVCEERINLATAPEKPFAAESWKH